MLLRAAEACDLPALIDVQQEGAVEGLGHIFPQEQYPFPREEIRVRWLRELRDPQIDVFVIEDPAAGPIVGFGAIRGDELLHFGTAVHTWGSGIATAAHEAIMDRLATTGVTRARLRVFEANYRARRFYEKQGWHSTGRRTRTTFAPHPVLIGYERDL